MYSWPHAPHQDDERTALKVLLSFFRLRLLVFAAQLAAPGQLSTTAFSTFLTLLTAATLFAAAYWAVGALLIRLPHDSRVFRRTADGFEEPAMWTPILNAIPNIAGLSPRDRRRLGLLVSQFLRYVRFEGAGGLEITDTIRLTIAAQACLLALNLPRGALARLKTIIVYPTTFLPRSASWHAADRELPAEPTLGESWSRGTVLFAWDQVAEGVRDPTDGHNVALHEFAHQLDTLGGDANGIPPLGSRARYESWVRVLEDSFGRFNREVRRGRPGTLNPYGATNLAEFFAVATETFFERPAELQHQYPELYDQLRRYYRQDPQRQHRAVG